MLKNLRIASTIARSLLRPKIQSPTEESSLSLRVWPDEVDVTFVNQAVYLLYCELGRWDFIFRSALRRLMQEKRCFPITASQSIRLLRPLRRFDPVTVSSRIRYWNDKWTFIEHTIASDDQLVALAVIKGIFRGTQGIVPAPEIMESLGAGPDAGRPPAHFVEWQDSEARMFERLRE